MKDCKDKNQKSELNIEKNKYHHGDLKETLIKAGVKLLLEEGPEKFSLRKVAAMCNVSHAAPYKHFASKEELINAISIYVTNEFANSLNEIKNDDPYEEIIELGKRYVYFMVENYDYLRYLFLNSNHSNPIVLENGEIKSNGVESFNVFLNCAKKCLKSRNIKEEDYAQNIIAMWAMVHGLATMISTNTLKCNGNYMDLVDDILRKNLKF